MILNKENIINDSVLEEKFSNMQGQLCSVTDRLDKAQKILDLERVGREDIIRKEVELRVEEEKELLRQEIEAKQKEERELLLQEYAVKQKEIEIQQAALRQREDEMLQKIESMQQKIVMDANRKIEEARI